ncbi:MAG: carboxymuconolactone decarboxylase family protein [Candidatus Sulfotelmatobacter sp.]
MARINLIAPESAPTEVREIYDSTLRGKPGNVQKALAHRPEMLKTFLSFYASVGRSLDRKLYELIYLRISLINGCRYCTQHHVASSKRVGLTPEDWTALKAGNYSRYGDKERAALAYVERLTRAPREITEADFEELKKHFSDPEIVDIHMLAGLANLTNRFTDPLGLELEFPEEQIQERPRIFTDHHDRSISGSGAFSLHR